MDDSELVFVPGGDFIMGANGSDNPQRVVTLSPFWIHRTEVTNRMYAACIAVGKCTPPENQQSLDALYNTSRQQHPITGVNWEQAFAYCEWIEGRLPTEAQWEKTARGEKGNIFPWGDGAADCDLANYGGCLDRTSRVRDNLEGRSYYEALGLAGNVAEWVLDWYDPLYYENSTATDPQGPVTGIERAYRGGGYASPDYHLPSATRFSDDPQENRPDLGFRCVVEDISPPAPYCVTSQYIAETNIPEYTYPESDIPQTGSGCSYGYIDFDTNVESIETTGGLECEVIGNRVRCTGTSSTSQTVVVCREGVESSTQTGNLPTAGGSCGPGYQPGSEYSCGYIGYTPASCDGKTCIEPTYGGEGEMPSCPLGMYFDTLAEMCIGGETPGTSCIEGYNYDAGNACCTSPAGTYPGCGPNEFMSSVGCIPYMPSSSTTTSGGCEEVTITTGVCQVNTEEPDEPDEPQDPGGGLVCVPPETIYCYYDTLLGANVCDCN